MRHVYLFKSDATCHRVHICKCTYAANYTLPVTHSEGERERARASEGEAFSGKMFKVFYELFNQAAEAAQV